MYILTVDNEKIEIAFKLKEKLICKEVPTKQIHTTKWSIQIQFL